MLTGDLNKGLRVLILEDMQSDAELVERELRSAGMEFVSMRVDDKDSFLRALGHFHPQLILADYSLPSFDGESALAIARQESPGVPFIFVTGALGEERAVELLKSGGATDFVLKDRLGRLPLCVKRALEEVEEKRRRRQAEEQLHRAHAELERKVEERTSDLSKSEARFRLLSETAGRLLASEDPQEIVNELCGQVMEHLDCHAFFNFLVDKKTGRLHLNACAGIPEQESRKIEWLDYGVAVCGCVARDEMRIVAEDIFRTLVKSYGIQAYACHPLKIEGKLIGTLSFGTRTRPRFSEQELALMKTVADQVAIAMERKSLIEELRKSKDELAARVLERTAELERRNLELQNFTFVASHDLQEPLRKMRTFGDMLQIKCGQSISEAGQDYLVRMQKTAARMQEILRSLIRYSRLTSDARPPACVDLRQIVRAVLSDLEIQITETNASVAIEDLPKIQADAGQMVALMKNLLGNALKFRREGESPRITIRSDCNGGGLNTGELKIYVEDNGIGFDEKYLDKVFVPFQQLHGRGEYEGVGMGLAICKKIVERHGGALSARSIPGKGSTFIIALPARNLLSK